MNFESSTSSPSPVHNPVIVGGRRLSIEEVAAVARGDSLIALSPDPGVRRRVDRGCAFLDRTLAEGAAVYGVNTGYGDSCSVVVPPQLVAELPLHLTRYHRCGLGEVLPEDAAMAVLVCRLNSLAFGYSGVRWLLLERLAEFINRGVVPRIPAEGSVGASGDLTPLSYVAATLVGEGEIIWRGHLRGAAEVHRELGLAPLSLAPKEGLAIMNGTSVMTGLACLAWERAEYLSRLSARITALVGIALQANRGHFDPRLFALKPHAGQAESAAWIHSDLGSTDSGDGLHWLQDRYSVRCAPHVIGVLRDALTWMRRDIENELNSANDNPLIDGEAGLILHGGHFYGGHVAFVMDALKTAVAGIADLLDRQIALLVDTRFNHGLPRNLSGTTGQRASINHGFKAVQIGVSAWAAEALKLTMPAASFSRSTECHNQDKVSMGTISARDCLRVLELAEQVAAAVLLAAWQGVQLRLRAGEIGHGTLRPRVAHTLAAVGAYFNLLDEDRPLEDALRRTVALVRARGLPMYMAGE